MGDIIQESPGGIIPLYPGGFVGIGTVGPPVAPHADPQSRSQAPKDLQGNPLPSVHLRHESGADSHQQRLRTGLAPVRNLSKNHQRLSQRMGRQALCRRALRHRDRTSLRRPSNRSYQTNPQRRPARPSCSTPVKGSRVSNYWPRAINMLRIRLFTKRRARHYKPQTCLLGNGSLIERDHCKERLDGSIVGVLWNTRTRLYT